MSDEPAKASADDLLEESRREVQDMPDPVAPLEEDYDTPAAAGGASTVPEDHPSRDSGRDPSEDYEGEDGTP